MSEATVPAAVTTTLRGGTEAVDDALAVSISTLLERVGGLDELRELRRTAVGLQARLDELVARCDAATEVESSRRRFSDEGLRTTADRIRRMRLRDARRADGLLVEEYADTAVTAGFAVASELVRTVRDALDDDRADVELAGRDDDLLAVLGGIAPAIAMHDWHDVVVRFESLRTWLAPNARRGTPTSDAGAQLAVLCAFALMFLERNEEAEAGLAAYLDEHPGPRVRCELAAALLWRGAVEEAARHAAAVAEDDANGGDGALALALVAEAQGEVAAAAELYRDAFAQWGVRRLLFAERVNLRQESGLYLRELAVARLRAGLAAEALGACDEALSRGVRGPETYPDEQVHRVRAAALRELGASRALLDEAELEVAKRDVWGGLGDAERLDAAIGLLRGLLDTERPNALAGWYLAEALRLRGWVGETRPDLDAAGAAEEAWQSWTTRMSADGTSPGTEHAWVYWSGANIAEDLDAVRPAAEPPEDPFALPPVPGLRWRALQRAEKAALLDPGDAATWATLARLLHSVGLTVAARDARGRALELDPTQGEASNERFVDLVRAHQPAEALAYLEGLGEEPRGVQILLRAWCRKEVGELTGASADLGAVDPDVWDPAMVLGVRWGLLVRQGRFEEARAALAELAALEPLDPYRALRRAEALAILGRSQEVERDLHLLGLPDTAERLATLVLAEATLGRDAEALAHAAELPQRAAHAGELLDAAELWIDAQALLAQEAATRSVAETLERARALVSGAGVEPPEDDAQLGQLAERYGADTDALTALLAVQARLSREAGAFEQAADAYRLLVGTAFDPESSYALHEVLRGQLAAAVDAGRATEARLLHELLAREDWSPYLTSAMAAATAYDNAGRPLDAFEALAEAAEHPDPSTRGQVNLWLGMREAEESPERGLAWLRDAARAVEFLDDLELTARIDARLGVLLVATGGPSDEIVGYLASALRAFAAGDDAAFALEFEVRRAASYVPAADSEQLREAYLAACTAEGIDPAPWGLTLDPSAVELSAVDLDGSTEPS
ncbi:hypothetical protein [Cellulomonas composti]|uniref:Uncharacterized protein n=1 Tax=Cellulomonas composti TaxID=266130 RepID=A0A511J7R0_9CELL|nr:hypothetical protein [Cellulomonas composti]GEL94018.1 hypothetical protein CCO02nite_06760 [Cellulomonas composti]